MVNGMTGTIIEAITLNNISVRFEDGVVVYNKKYYDFIDGKIGHPDINPNKLNCIGEKRRMNCGMDATITRYENWADMDIRFDDGEVVCNTNRSGFTKGSISHPVVTRGNFVYKGFVAKRAFTDNQDVYYTCRCTKCNHEDIFTLYQMIEHEKKCNK